MIAFPIDVALAIHRASRATFIGPSQGSNKPGNAPYQRRGRAWVRALDMVPDDVIAGDVKLKLIGPCADAESYVLGLRYIQGKSFLGVEVSWFLSYLSTLIQNIICCGHHCMPVTFMVCAVPIANISNW
ncbi:hypothetical protein K503DRAFT_229009 [Rhizopogon vinicolor AM-OR11-026]|uniref:Uncharacterized protein n=1 Tax=Rhizopogon vinicolor AM-OR11-026 TaxID=1314800 RepID=A0A1B7MY35_9AGAM|nr:hypothetical protein K503DRAFT_229009 [Rhizopogon vinicolor AM-OR11-026]